MLPPKREMTFEKIKTDDFVLGTIQDIVYEEDHLFKGFAGQPDKKQVGVRLVFSVDGYQYLHKTPWMKFVYSAKANIFNKYVLPLVQGAAEWMDFDLDQLKGMRVKMLWKDVGEFQGIETIRPADGKKIIPANHSHAGFHDAAEPDDEVPF
jgi:hypothetical protein